MNNVKAGDIFYYQGNGTHLREMVMGRLENMVWTLQRTREPLERGGGNAVPATVVISGHILKGTQYGATHNQV